MDLLARCVGVWGSDGGGGGGGGVIPSHDHQTPGPPRDKRDRTQRLEEEGGGHCLFEGRYPLPNYRPCFSGLSVPLFLRVTDQHYKNQALSNLFCYCMFYQFSSCSTQLFFHTVLG